MDQCFLQSDSISDSSLPLEEGNIFLPCYYSDISVVEPNKGGIIFWPRQALKSKVDIIVIFVIPAADKDSFCIFVLNCQTQF